MKNQVQVLFKPTQIQNLLWSLIAISIVMLSSCKDTFETDISGETVQLNTPQDEYSFIDPNVSFWWNAVSGATSYNLKIIQIDTNLNNATVRLVVDSNLTANQFLIGLDPGSYEWGIIAYNGGYETDYYYRTFYIDSTLDISNISLVLSSPSNNFISKDTNFTFSWESLYSADYYTWELRSPDENGSLISTLSDITTTSVSADVDVEGSYAWAIYAHNNLSNTSSKKVWRTITIDRTSPNAPNLLLPAQIDTLYNEDLVSDKIKFSWDAPTDNGSALSYQLYISSDSLFTDLAELDNISVSDTTYLWTPNGTYSKFYWRMKAIDAAGNESVFSLERRFWYYNQ